MTIAIHSFDFDGCLRRSVERDIIADNEELFKKIINENKDKSHNYIFIGSLRQCHGMDSLKSIQNENGSVFAEMPKVISHLGQQLNVSFVPLLLADIYGKLPLGTSHERIMRSELLAPLDQKLDVASIILFDIWNTSKTKFSQELFLLEKDKEVTLESIKEALRNKVSKFKVHVEHGMFADWLLSEISCDLKNQVGIDNISEVYKNHFECNHTSSIIDCSKVSILYAQMHERASALAKTNPNETFEFNFYDDTQQIIDELKGFYTEFKHLIPKNMKLRLHTYSGTINPNYQEIQGTGSADENYAETVRKFTMIADKNKGNNIINLARSEKFCARLRSLPKDDTFATAFNKTCIAPESKAEPLKQDPNPLFIPEEKEELPLKTPSCSNFILMWCAGISALLLAIGLLMAYWPDSSSLVTSIGCGLTFFGGAGGVFSLAELVSNCRTARLCTP